MRGRPFIGTLCCALFVFGLAAHACAAKRRAAAPSRPPRAIKLYRGDAQRSGVTGERGPAMLQRQRWARELVGPVRGIVFHDGAVYAGAGGGLFVFDARTGAERWSFVDAARSVSPPAIDGDTLYLCAGPRLHAIDLRTHAALWSFDADASLWSSPPLIADGVAYVGSANGTVYAIDLATRAERWRAAHGSGVRTYLTASEGLVFVTQNGGLLRALDAADGRVVWTKTLSGDNDWTEVAAGQGLVFAGAGGNDLYALDARTGAVRWTFIDTNSDRSGWNAPIVANGVVYAGNRNRRMFAFDAASGRELWRVATDDAATSDAILADGVLYFGVGSHGAPDDEAPRDVYALDAATGAVLSRLRTPGLILGGCDVGDGAVFLHTLARTLVAIE